MDRDAMIAIKLCRCGRLNDARNKLCTGCMKEGPFMSAEQVLEGIAASRGVPVDMMLGVKRSPRK